MARTLAPALDVTEDAIVAALQANATLAANTRDIRSFSGTYQQALQEAQRTGQATLLVLWLGGPSTALSVLEETLTSTWAILVLARSFRSEKARRHDVVAGEVGAYGLVEAVISVLQDNQLSLEELTPLRLTEVELVHAEARNLAVYQVLFEAEHILAEADGDDDLELVHATYAVNNPDEDDDGADDFTHEIEETVSV